MTDLWRQAEETVTCTCGLIAVGYRASWAIQHAEKCPVTAAYRAGSVEHVIGGTCWCQPTTAYEEPLTGDRVFVHRRIVA